MYSQMRAAVINACPTHEGCDGTCAGGPPSSARPVLFGAPASTVQRQQSGPAFTHGRTQAITLGDTLGAYRYTRLAPGTIRLLKVHKAVFRDDAVVCEVVVCPLDDAPQYAALSYCWGTEGNECKILLVPDGKVFAARRSLEAALKRFRAAADSAPLHAREDYLWADAVCINQKDNVEKTEQLLMMEHIYKRAEAVYVDFGDEQPEWRSTYSLMTRAAVAAEKSPPAYDSLPSENDVSYMHYWRLFARPWFTRTWIVQEFVHAKRVMAMLGPCIFWWYELELSFALLISKLEAVPLGRYGMSAAEQTQIRRGIQNYLSIEQIRESIEAGRPNSIRFMELSRRLCVTKAKDKIFALLSLFPEDERAAFDDYSIPAYKIFVRFAIAQVERNRAVQTLDHAGLARRRGNIGGLPSWVPDWTFTSETDSPKKFAVQNKSSSSGSGCPRAQNGAISNGCLILDGFTIDTLLVVQDSPIFDLRARGTTSFFDRGGIKRARWALQWYHGLCASAYSDPNREFVNLLARLCKAADTNKAEGDDVPTVPDLLETYEEFMSMSIDELRRADRAGHMWRFLLAVRECLGLTFCITNKGYMALVPSVAKAGDKIVVFAGREVLFLIRYEPEREGALLVGDVYVHGITASDALAFDGVSKTQIVLE
ncbi:putative heterokaryon incompatibility protein [Phaeoacremonium minimum UCRPA7]|uniref:Putative heterokaryon incompatibility protein n=1 Tax=Phaeoacremonium minimum (strain UCR-PA7) TaxID=1286976 RepID=R8B8H8_PHAM7|nr:putative heterokaryon incompatibility protein [Phaeoacremonium minimum UCRPA7]EON95610.1 putative heterokaryon incompatibility protein [Phaeoacremonium minimum UCRPA7]